jgi:hypothetical protein
MTGIGRLEIANRLASGCIGADFRLLPGVMPADMVGRWGDHLAASTTCPKRLRRSPPSNLVQVSSSCFPVLREGGVEFRGRMSVQHAERPNEVFVYVRDDMDVGFQVGYPEVAKRIPGANLRRRKGHPNLGGRARWP